MEEERHLRFGVTLMIGHPSLDRAEITQALGIEPMYGWNAGETRRTPIGTPLPGRYANTYWGFSEAVRGKRAFFESAIGMLERLEAASDFIRSITEEGGTVSINLGLYGGRNIGDVIDWTALMRFAALKVNLGVEVFSTMQRKW